jgi:hypothetical protein
MANTYAFPDFDATYVGPAGTYDLSSYGVAADGITIAFAEDAAAPVMGANGDGMYNLRAARHGIITIRAFKVALLNAVMSRIFTFETSDSSNYGQALLTCRNAKTGDLFVCRDVGIRKFPDNGNGVEGAANEWAFNSLRIIPTLGDGNPDLSRSGLPALG